MRIEERMGINNMYTNLLRKLSRLIYTMSGHCGGHCYDLDLD